MSKNGSNGRLVSAAVILGVASLVSRVVGLIRERVLTTTFGAGDVFDAFIAAFRVPDLIFNLVVVGALSAAFIPLFTEKMIAEKDGEKNAHMFALSIMNIVVIGVGILSVLYAALANYLVPYVAPGFEGEKLKLTIELSRIMALQPILLGMSFVLSGILNSYKRFVAYALAPILYNVGIIVGVVFFVPRMGPVGLAWGVVFGACLHFFAQLPSALVVGFRWRPRIRGSYKDMRTLGRMMLPRVVGLAAMQVNLITVTVIGSTLAAGSVAVFHLANNLHHIPVGIFGIAFAQAAFPTLAEHVARGEMNAFKRTLTRAFRYIMFFVVPVSLYFFLLRAQIVRVLFGDGRFDWEDTILTYETFGWLIISIFAQAAIPLLARGFYVQQNTKIPVLISVVSMVLNIVLAVLLAPVMGVQGLGLAFSAAAITNLVLLLGVLHWQLGDFDDTNVLLSMLRIMTASLAGGIVLQVLKYPVASAVDMTRFWGVFLQVVVTGGFAVVTYLIVMWYMKSEEIIALRKYIPRKAKVELAPGTETTRFEGLSE